MFRWWTLKYANRSQVTTTHNTTGTRRGIYLFVKSQHLRKILLMLIISITTTVWQHRHMWHNIRICMSTEYANICFSRHTETPENEFDRSQNVEHFVLCIFRIECAICEYGWNAEVLIGENGTTIISPWEIVCVLYFSQRLATQLKHTCTSSHECLRHRLN